MKPTAIRSWHLVSLAAALAVGDKLHAAGVTYNQDSVNRLTNAAYSDGSRESYSYDAAGNRLSRVILNPLTISAIPDQTATGGVSTAAISFSVNNPNVPPDSLMLQARTSDINVLPLSAIAFGGSGSNRSLTITPPVTSVGTAYVTVVVNDGVVGAATRFLVYIMPPNRPPIAVNDSAQYPPGESVKIWGAKLLANDSDPDGDPITLTAVAPDTPHGGTANLDGPWLIYTPPAGFTGTDTVTYTIADNRGATTNGIVTLTLQTPGDTPAANIVGVETLSNGHKVIRFAGIPTLTYQIQASTNLMDWITLGTSTAGANGKYVFEDVDAASFPSRFYRSVYP